MISNTQSHENKEIDHYLQNNFISLKKKILPHILGKLYNIMVTGNEDMHFCIGKLFQSVIFKPTCIVMVTLQTFYLGKLNLLTVYLGKLTFFSVNDFSPSNLEFEISLQS